MVKSVFEIYGGMGAMSEAPAVEQQLAATFDAQPSGGRGNSQTQVEQRQMRRIAEQQGAAMSWTDQRIEDALEHPQHN